MKAGEVKDVEVTFPDPYPNNTDLSGKPAVFKMTMNSVKVKVEGKLTDEFLAAHDDTYTTVQQLHDDVEAYLQDSNEKRLDSMNRQNAVEMIIDNSEITSIPQEDYINNRDSIKNNYVGYYEQYTSYGMFSGTLEEFMEQFFGIKTDDAEAYFKDYGERNTKYELVLTSVALKENIEATDKDIQELIDQYYAQSGYATEEEFIDAVGGRNFLIWYIVRNKALDFIVANNSFVDADGNVVEYPLPTEAPTAAPTEAPAGDASPEKASVG